MPDIIKLLPDHVANQIAAGEVIQRPASVVKELLENAIDAGATRIKVIVKEAGKSLIQVVDNGKGMTTTDARLSLERHATSKIASADDLFSLQTKGFRGEALASMASVSQLEMKTKQEHDELGTRLLVTGSKIDVQEPVASMTGTDVAINKLFFNIPARRKFLKTDATEFRYIFHEFNRIALAHPAVNLELFHNDKLIINLPAETELKRILGVLGKSYQNKLILIDERTELVNITGYVGTTESIKVSRGDQYLFINNRFFKSAYFHHAITSAYASLLPDGKHPAYVIFLQIDPAKIDVNVHPTKQEIKFEDDRAIYNYVKVAVRYGLAKHHMIPLMEFEPPSPFLRAATAGPHQNAPTQGSFSPPIQPQHRPEGWEQVFEGLHESASQSETGELLSLINEKGISEASIHNSLRFHGYLVKTTAAGLMLVDQRAAHIRVLYEEFLRRNLASKAPSQGLLFPKTIELSPANAAVLNGVLDQMNQLGFDIAPFGQQSFVLHGLPAFHEMVEMGPHTIEEMVDQLAAETYQGDEIEGRLAAVCAKSAAISSDKKLSDTEIRHLVEQLFSCDLADRTPDGRPCYVIISRHEIDKKFKKQT